MSLYKNSIIMLHIYLEYYKSIYKYTCWSILVNPNSLTEFN